MKLGSPHPAPGATIPEVEHHLVDAGGVRWHLVTAGTGDGPVVVLTAGYPQSWYAWRRVIPLLAEHFSVVAVDLPGQGDSGPSPSGHTAWEVVGLLEDLFVALDLSRVTFVGHDVGAWVGFALGYRSADRLDALVLVDADIAGVNLDLDDDGGYGGWHFIFQRTPELPEAMLPGHERLVIEWFSSRMTRHRTDEIHSSADLDEYERAYRRPTSLTGMIEYYRAVPANGEFAASRVDPLPVPLLVLAGARSTADHLATGLSAYATTLESVVLEDTGHYVPEERPEEVAAAISAFIARTGVVRD